MFFQWCFLAIFDTDFWCLICVSFAKDYMYQTALGGAASSPQRWRVYGG